MKKGVKKEKTCKPGDFICSVASFSEMRKLNEEKCYLGFHKNW